MHRQKESIDKYYERLRQAREKKALGPLEMAGKTPIIVLPNGIQKKALFVRQTPILGEKNVPRVFTTRRLDGKTKNGVADKGSLMKLVDSARVSRCSSLCTICSGNDLRQVLTLEVEYQQLQCLLRQNCHPDRSPTSESSALPRLLSSAHDDLKCCSQEIEKGQSYISVLQKSQKDLKIYLETNAPHCSFRIREPPPELAISSLACPNCFGDILQSVSSMKSRWNLLRSFQQANYHLSRSAPAVAQLLSSIKHAMQLCEKEIARYDFENLSPLRTHSKLLSRLVSGYESITAPIRKLSNELLCEIFVHVGKENRFDKEGIIVPGLVLEQVCSSWRAASNIKELWQEISLDTTDCSNFQRWLPAVTLILEKSEIYPLTVSANIRKHEPDNVWLVLRALAMQSHRWVDLTVDFSRPHPNLSFTAQRLTLELADIKGNLPVLHSLSLRPEFGNMIPATLANLFAIAPQLRTVTIPDLNPREVSSMPWGKMQTITVEDPCKPLYVLSHCPQLVNLHLRLGQTAFSEEPSLKITSPLRCLILKIKNNSNSLRPLSNLTLPALRSLSIRPPGDLGSLESLTRIGDIESLIIRSRCALTSLSWTNMSVEFTQWISFLRLCSFDSLETLSIVESVLGDRLASLHFFDELCGCPGASPILPALQHLFIDDQYGTPFFSTGSIICALESRRLENKIDVRRLKSFKLEVCETSFPAECVPRMQKLVDGGLEMFIRDKSGIVLCSSSFRYVDKHAAC
ncbi:hypothetical protein C8J56DRAFT_1164179 [Mycena floridula]|nr:hypothetical protein C8J56DRAFT_1164179 [Mycena floridula]